MKTPTPTPVQSSNSTVLETDQYLTFRLADELFAVTVGRVVEILEMPRITQVPKAPPFLRGVVNLRGNILPVVDTRLKFGLGSTEVTTDTVIIVFEIRLDGLEMRLGALADAAQSVVEIAPAQMEPPPSLGTRYRAGFIEAMAKLDDRFIMVLDIDAVFSFEELAQMDRTEEAEGPAGA